MRCMRCGAELRPDAKFCGVCGQVLGGSAGPGSYQQTASQAPVSNNYSQTGGYPPAGSYMPDYSSTGSYPAPLPARKDVSRMQAGIALGTDERIVRQYQIGRFTLRQGAIEVIVTNKRVIRFEDSSLFGLRNARIDEINIDSVHGVSTDLRRSFNPVVVSLALLLVLVGLILLFNSRSGFPENLIPAALLLIGILILVFSFKPRLEFKIHGSVGSSVLETEVNTHGRMFRGTGVVFQFRPTDEVTVMLKEIGALMYDLKTMGDAAISRWV